MHSHKPHIAVFFGGSAGNHDLSFETGRRVSSSLPRSSYRVIPVHVTSDGAWQVPLGTLPQHGSVDPMLARLWQGVPALPPARALERLLHHPVSAFMTVVRGPGGDDGALHALGETLGIPVAGSGRATSHRTSDKDLLARSVEDLVSTPYSRRFRASVPTDDIVADIEDEFTPPFLVKPVHAEGSVGIMPVTSVDAARAAIDSAKQHGDILIQEEVPGVEVSFTLSEDATGHVHLLPITRIQPVASPFYDHAAKREAGRVHLETADALASTDMEIAAVLARELYDELGCRGLVSIDMILTPAGPELLEINTIPTLTAYTPLLSQLKTAGVHPGVVLDSIVRRTLS